MPMNDIDDTNSLEFYDKTPLMEVWIKDANQFGIPHRVQKGLMFITALGMRVSYQARSLEDWIGFTNRMSKKIRIKSPHIAEGEGLDYSSKNITELLTELAKRFIGDEFTPRRYAPANLYAGQTFQIEGQPYNIQDGGWYWEGKSRLPDCLCEEMWKMADWDEVMTSLCDQIGENIQMNLEGAYLAGFLYFEKQHRMDKEASLQITQLVSGMLPPKFMWFRHLMNFDPKTSGQGNPMQKVLDCFLVGIPEEAPLLYRLVTFLSDQLHYNAPGQKDQRIWDSSLIHFACVVLSQRNWFTSDAVSYFSDYGASPPDGAESDCQGIQELIKYLEEREWVAPNHCNSLEAAFAAVVCQIENHYGYSILDDSENLTYADAWTRRACILHVSTVNTIINPEWNCFE